MNGRYLRRDLRRPVRFQIGGVELPVTVERAEVFMRDAKPDFRLVLRLDWEVWTRIGDTAAFGFTPDSLSPHTPTYSLASDRPIELTIRVDPSLLAGVGDDLLDALECDLEAGRPELLDAGRHRWIEVLQAIRPDSSIRMGARSKDAEP